MSTTVETSTLLTVCKLRWVPKAPEDQMVIPNLEALRLMVTAILLEQRNDWAGAKAAEASARQKLDDELKEYLAGVQHTLPFTSDDTFGMGDLGDPL